MHIRSGVSLKQYNTFGIDAMADHFVELSTEKEIIEFIKEDLKDYKKFLILGGGSNILFADDFPGLVMHIVNKGISIVSEEDDQIVINVCAGEVWDEFVDFCVLKGYSGIENLSMIPGSVGASPIQNIGAYGVELKDHFRELRAIHLSTGEVRRFTKEECRFGYRDSIFKNELKGRYLVLDVTLELSKVPDFQTDYGVIGQELEAMDVSQLSIAAIRQAVCNIRSRKLPDPEELGNGGSFFKNPVIGNHEFELLKKKFPQIVSFLQDENHMKLAAGWLIDNAGWKGYREGDAGVHSEQALVLVNYGNASGHDILKLSKEICDSVFKMYNIELEREINVI